MTENSPEPLLFEEKLAFFLEKRGFKSVVPLAMRNEREGFVLALRGEQRLIIRCRRYESPSDPEYINAAPEAMESGRIGRRYILTVDDVDGDTHRYTVHLVGD